MSRTAFSPANKAKALACRFPAALKKSWSTKSWSGQSVLSRLRSTRFIRQAINLAGLLKPLGFSLSLRLWRRLADWRKKPSPKIEKPGTTLFHTDLVFTELAGIQIMFLLILLFCLPLWQAGHIVFSDLDFPADSRLYLKQIFGLWNDRFSSANMFNLPRLPYIILPYLLSTLFGYSGSVMIKSFIYMLLTISALSMYVMARETAIIYFKQRFTFFRYSILIFCGIFYALNPWVIFRIQHIYLLCGYSVFPLVIKFFLNIFHPKYQAYSVGSDKFYTFRTRLYRQDFLNLIKLSFVLALASGAIHYLFYSAMYLSVVGGLILAKYALIYFWRYSWQRCMIFVRLFLKKAAWFMVFFLFFNSYSIVTYFAGIFVFDANPSQHNINTLDTLALFSRNSSLTNVLYMTSYWWPMFDLATLPLSFYISGALILLVVGLGIALRGWRHSLIFWLVGTSFLFIAISTGTHITGLDTLFIRLTKLPVIGNIFRDSNKTIGILAFNYGVLMFFGFEHLFNYLRSNLSGRAVELVTAGLLTLCMFFYVQPFLNRFINGFYHPVDIPEAYNDINRHFLSLSPEEQQKSKTLYLPLAENMIQPHNTVSTPFWNRNNDLAGRLKATGDFQVYNSLQKSLFHHEGNIPSLGYYYNYLQYLIDRGLTARFFDYLKPLGISTLNFHDEYLGHRTRQNFNRQIIELGGRQSVYNNDIFSVYPVQDTVSQLRYVPRRILSPYGYSKLAGLFSLPGFKSDNYSLLYSTLDKEPYHTLLRPGDYIEASDQLDLALSLLPKKYYFSAFGAINQANPFLNWSKTFLKNPDWAWYMNLLGIENPVFDFTMEEGVSLTFAGAQFNRPNYTLDEVNGRLILDLDKMLKQENFFIPDNPGLFNVSASPLTEDNFLSRMHGDVVKGVPKKVWQVGKSNYIRIRENTLYAYRLKVSGRGVNKLHFKVRYYDQKLDEIALSYVSAPSEKVDFDGMDFYGEYITPKDALYCRIDLMTYQRPTRKQYWWIHEFLIREYEGFTQPNLIKIDPPIEKNASGELFARFFSCQKGGILRFEINGREILINTQSERSNRFVWKSLGNFTFAEDSPPLIMDNITGFNAVNLFAFVPDYYKPVHQRVIIEKARQSRLFFTLEPEIDFDYQGDIQTRRSLPEMRGGRGVASQDGALSRDFDILKAGAYSLNLLVHSPSKNTANLTVRLAKVSEDLNNPVYEEVFYPDRLPDSGPPLRHCVDRDDFAKFLYSLRDLPGVAGSQKTLTIDDLNLEPGAYRLEIVFDSKADSLSLRQNLIRFEPSSVIVPDFMKEERKDGVSCSPITPDMYKIRHLTDKTVLGFEKTDSNDWYIFATPHIPVKEGFEYLVKLAARSSGGRKRHFKVVYLDRKKYIIGDEHVAEIEAKYHGQKNEYQQLFIAPREAEYLVLQCLIKSENQTDDFIEIFNLEIYPYSEFLLVDGVTFTEGRLSEFFPLSVKTPKIVEGQTDSMSRQFTIKYLQEANDPMPLFRFNETYHPLWRVADNPQKKLIMLDGLQGGFIADPGKDTSEVRIFAVLKNVYYFGLVLLLPGFGLWIYLARRNKH